MSLPSPTPSVSPLAADVALTHHGHRPSLHRATPSRRRRITVHKLHASWRFCPSRLRTPPFPYRTPSCFNRFYLLESKMKPMDIVGKTKEDASLPWILMGKGMMISAI